MKWCNDMKGVDRSLKRKGGHLILGLHWERNVQLCRQGYVALSHI